MTVTGSAEIVNLRTYPLRAPVDASDNFPVACPMSIYPEYRTSRALWRDDFGPLVVEIEADNGLIGIGFTSMGGIASALAIQMHLKRLVIGKDVRDTKTISDVLIRSSLHQGRDGYLMHAISAIDLALWDLLGKIQEKPVCELLGSKPGASLPCYLTGYDVKKAREEGFTGLKWPLKFGPASGDTGFLENIKDIESLRSALGPNVAIMIDCWMGLDVEYTCRLIEALKPLRIKWIEEPLIAGDLAGYTALRERADPSVGIACGEHETLVRGAMPFFTGALVDYWQSDVTWAGGITEMVKIAELAMDCGISLVPHYSFTPWAAHFCFSSNACEEIEWYDLTADHDDGEAIFTSDTEFREGRLYAGTQPGFGVNVNWNLLHKHIDDRVQYALE